MQITIERPNPATRKKAEDLDVVKDKDVLLLKAPAVQAPRHLRIKVVAMDWGKSSERFMFQVTAQSHINTTFNNGSSEFTYGGATLISSHYHELRLMNTWPLAYVLGDFQKGSDEGRQFWTQNHDINRQLENLAKIFSAVRMYNTDKTIDPVEYIGPKLPK